MSRNSVRIKKVAALTVGMFLVGTGSAYALWNVLVSSPVKTTISTGYFTAAPGSNGDYSGDSITEKTINGEKYMVRPLNQATGDSFERSGDFHYQLDATPETYNGQAPVNYELVVNVPEMFKGSPNPWHEYGTFAIVKGECQSSPTNIQYAPLKNNTVTLTSTSSESARYCLYGHLSDEAKSVYDSSNHKLDTSHVDINDYVNDSKAVYKNTVTATGVSAEDSTTVTDTDYWMTWIKRFNDPGPGSIEYGVRPVWMEGICRKS